MDDKTCSRFVQISDLTPEEWRQEWALVVRQRDRAVELLREKCPHCVGDIEDLLNELEGE